jgi:hypothetical protein
MSSDKPGTRRSRAFPDWSGTPGVTGVYARRGAVEALRRVRPLATCRPGYKKGREQTSKPGAAADSAPDPDRGGAGWFSPLCPLSPVSRLAALSRLQAMAEVWGGTTTRRAPGPAPAWGFSSSDSGRSGGAEAATCIAPRVTV